VLGAPPRQERKKEWAPPPKDSPAREEWDEKKEWEEKGWWWNPWKKGWVWWGKDEEEGPRNRDRSPVRLRSTSNRRRNYANRGAEAAPAAGATLEIGAEAAPAAGATLETGDPEASPRGPPWSGKKRSWARSRRKSHLPALAKAQNP
jgi:hypothetical protein